MSFGREIVLGPSKKFGTKNQTSYRIVTLSKYECDVCQFSYVGENVNKLKGHNKTRHECEICGDRFEYSILQKHKGTHVQDSFECVICYKRFPGSGDLNQFRCQDHLNMHANMPVNMSANMSEKMSGNLSANMSKKMSGNMSGKSSLSMNMNPVSIPNMTSSQINMVSNIAPYASFSNMAQNDVPQIKKK